MTVTVKYSLYMTDLIIKINHEQHDKVTGAVDFRGRVRRPSIVVGTGCQSRESTLTKYLLYCL